VVPLVAPRPLLEFDDEVSSVPELEDARELLDGVVDMYLLLLSDKGDGGLLERGFVSILLGVLRVK
jgi:hypothetical protein